MPRTLLAAAVLAALLCLSVVAHAAGPRETRHGRLTVLESWPLRPAAPVGSASTPSPLASTILVPEYSNITSFTGQTLANGGAVDQAGNLITRLVADDITPAGANPGAWVTEFRFSIANTINQSTLVRPRVRFWNADGSGGAPGTYYSDPMDVEYDFNPVAISGLSTILVSAMIPTGEFAMPGSTFWAGLTFDNADGTTGASVSQLNAIGQGVFGPPNLGSSADHYFRTDVAGSFYPGDDPAGTFGNFGGNPAANFGWEFSVESAGPLVLPAVLVPSSPDCWFTVDTTQAGAFEVAWTEPSSHVDHIDVRYSTDGIDWPAGQMLGQGIDPHAATTLSGTFPFPQANSASARVRLDCYTVDDSLLGQVESAPFALANDAPVRFAVERYGQLVGDPPVFTWATDPAADHYDLVFTPPAEPAGCAPPAYPEVLGIPGNFRWAVVDSASWLSLPPDQYDVSVFGVRAGGGDSLLVQTSFVKAGLVDLDPDDPGNEPPAILVHGWTGTADAWSHDGMSPLVDGLINAGGAPGERFHPWAFAYPNLGSVRESAAALGLAFEYVDSTSSSAVGLVAHDMGGLVVRALLQGYARMPRTGAALPAPADSSVSRVATLATPHLGMDWGPPAAAAYFVTGCSAAPGSASAIDLQHASAFIAALNGPADGATALPPIEYFLAAGTLHDDRAAFVPNPRDDMLERACSLGSDDTVDLCSALAGECGGGYHATTSVPLAVGAQVVRGTYGLSHAGMALPGIPAGSAASDSLLTDLLTFMRCGGSCLVSADCPTPPSLASLRFLVTSPGTQGKPRQGVLPSAAADAPVVGAILNLCPTGNDPASSGIRLSTDLAGEATAVLPAGAWDLYLSGAGLETRHETLDVTPLSADARYEFSLSPDPAHVGPTNPYVGRQTGGSPADSVLHLSVSCVNASEMRVAVPVSALDTGWIPYQSTLDLDVGAGYGVYQVFARFRDALGTPGDSVSCVATVNPPATGDVQVDSTPSGASVFADGRDTGLTTPALVSALEPGYHRVTASLPGYRSAPGVSTVEVDAGLTAPASFVLTASAPPSAAPWLSPPAGALIGPSAPVSWVASSDPDPEDAVLYNLAAFADSTLADRVWALKGVSGTSILLPPTYPDSSMAWLTVVSVDTRSVEQSDPAASIPVIFDGTAPEVTVLRPAAGDTVGAAFPDTIVMLAADWSLLDSLVIVLSHDAGGSFPDTLYAGAFVDTMPFPDVDRNSNEAVLRALVFDAAGNVGTDDSDSLFTILKDVTSVGDPGGAPRAVLSVDPNPLRRAATVRYSLPREDRVRLFVFDLAGRRVRLLVDELQAPGDYRVVWDGKGERGRRVPGGVYFLRLAAGDAAVTRKVLVLE